MMGSYTEETEKIKFYRKRIAEELLRAGIPPDSSSVEEITSKIDSRLSLFQYSHEQAGEDFSPEKFNRDFSLIYEDLLILYKAVYEVCIKEYGELNEFTESRLKELDSLVKKLREKADFERNTLFGRTLYMETGNFSTRIENDTAIINLGEIEAAEGSFIACFIEGESVQQENAVFSFDGKNCSPYGFNKDVFEVPGKVSLKQYYYELPEDHITYALRKMNPEGISISEDNSYVIYAGKNMVKTGSSYTEKQGNTGITIKDEGEVSFWLTGAAYMDFAFSDEPLEANFNGRYIRNLSREKAEYFTFRHGKNFSMDIVTDGVIYAERKDGYLFGGHLYYSNNDELRDFLIEEESQGRSCKFSDVKVLISGINPGEELKISHIAIKELGEKSS